MGEEGSGEEDHANPGGGPGVILSPVIPWGKQV